MHKCEVCNAKVGELRRGRCWGCYSQWVDARPVGLGAKCCVCTERRREHLKTAEILGAWLPVCYACHSRTMALSPMPQSLAEIRTTLRRDRRDDDRRFGKSDTRVFQWDRRGDDRRDGRSMGDDDCLLIDDDMIVEIELLEESLEFDNFDGPELTRIHAGAEGPSN